jgi:YARHG domain/Bacterial SH3 domain
MWPQFNLIKRIFRLAIVVSFITSLGWQLTTAATEEVYGSVTTDNTALNIRAGMGTDTKIIAKALNGSRLRILEAVDSWYKVQLSNGKIGYASADYIKILPNDTGKITPTEPVTPYQTHLNQGNSLHDQGKIKAAYQEYLKAYQNASSQREQEIAWGSLVATQKYLQELLAISPDKEWAKKLAEQMTTEVIKPESTESHSTSLEIPIPSPATTQAQVPGRYPEVSTRYLNDSDLEKKSTKELKIMRNEIFARHGYLFEPGEMKDYFTKQSWYQPQSADVGSLLSPIEQANIQRIKEYE